MTSKFSKTWDDEPLEPEGEGHYTEDGKYYITSEGYIMETGGYGLPITKPDVIQIRHEGAVMNAVVNVLRKEAVQVEIELNQVLARITVNTNEMHNLEKKKKILEQDLNDLINAANKMAKEA